MSLLNIETFFGSLSRIGSSAPVQIGDVTLTGFEVPDRLSVGGTQALVIHRLPGGDRIIDAVGNDPDRVEISGKFVGPTAQSRAQLLEKMRKAAQPVTLTAAGLSLRVIVRYFRYDYQSKGAICPYSLQVELPAETSNASPLGTSALSGLIGSDATSGLSSITNAISDVSNLASNVTGQFQAVIGQVTPIANLIGIGGPLAKVSNDLQVAQGVATAGTNLAALPQAASSIVSGLQDAGDNLMTTISQAGTNLESIQPNNAASRLALLQNAALLSASVDAGGAVNRAAINTAVATNAPVPAPVVHG